ncbi:ATP-binding cassette domain-containing protein [Alkalihalobacillus sp. FSL W8-0930]
MGILEVNDLKIHYPIKGGLFRRTVGHVKAVDGVSIKLEKGQTYGLVGESGSGKTTTGRSVIGLNSITSGSIEFEGQDITKGLKQSTFDLRRDVQMIFQDPYSSLNQKKRIIDLIAEPIRNFEKLSKVEEKKRVLDLLEQVGLNPESIYKYPHQFSGGQRQRIGIARAIALNPKLIIADEPVSALDVSVQAQVLNFLQEIQSKLDLTYLFISHDLGIIKHICDKIGIMYKGRLVEEGTSEDIFNNPQHIYTKRLIAAIPDINPENRDMRAKLRFEVRDQYNDSLKDYFNPEGEVYDLRPLTNTHLVAMPEKGE